MNSTTKTIALFAVGIALFVVLSLCLQVPVFENYYLCLGYVVMVVYCYSFGVILYCVVISGLRGMPGWALGNIVIGVALGLSCMLSASMKNRALRYVLLVAVIVASVALGILGVKSLTECLLYAQPFLLRVGKNTSAFIADVVVLVVSLPVCEIVDRQAKKYFPQLSEKR